MLDNFKFTDKPFLNEFISLVNQFAILNPFLKLKVE
jgi:hypothetical protein